MTTPAPPVTPATPRPPDSRMRWHILAALSGLLLAAAIVWCTERGEPALLCVGGFVLASLLWALVASQSSLGYLVPGLALGAATLVHQFAMSIPRVGVYLLSPSAGVIAAVSLGLAVALHFARKDGKDAVRRDELAAAVHASHAPESRRSRHILGGLGAALLAGVALMMVIRGDALNIDRAGASVFGWDTLAALTLIAIAAALGSVSAWAPLAAGLVGVAFTALHVPDLVSIATPWNGPEATLHGVLALTVGTLLLLAGSLSCRLARRSGQRAARHERAIG